MGLTWNIREVEGFADLFITNGDDEPELNVLTSTIIHLTMAVGMNRITRENVKTFYIRCKELEVAYGMKGFLYITAEDTTRNPTLAELQAHIGLQTNASTMTNRKWGNELKRHVQLTARTLEAMELGEQDNEM